MPLKNQSNKKIIFFDGHCTLCNRFINFMMARNSDLKFASLQGKTAQAELDSSIRSDVETMVYKTGHKTYFKSDAALISIGDLGGIWKTVLLFRLVPRFIRDGVYMLISKNRYKWFGKRESCRIPTETEREKLLD